MPGPGSNSKTGKRFGIALIVLWLVILVGVYVVIVRLKIAGEEGIRSTPQEPAPTSTSPQ